jgi:hypothetical protein
MTWLRTWTELLAKYPLPVSVVDREDALPWKVQMAGGPKALATMSANPIHIGDSGWT